MVSAVPTSYSDRRYGIRRRFYERDIHTPAEMIRYGNDAEGVVILEDVFRRQGDDIILRLHDHPDLQVQCCVDVLEYAETKEDFSIWHRGAEYILAKHVVPPTIAALLYYGLGRQRQVAAHYDEAILFFEQGLAIAGKDAISTRGRLHFGLGTAYQRISQWGRAEDHLNIATDMLRDTDQHRLLAMVMFEYGGLVYRSAGKHPGKRTIDDYLASVDIYQQTLELFARTSSIMWRGMVEYSIAWSYLQINQFKQAAQHFDAAWQWVSQLQNNYDLALTRDVALIRYGQGALLARIEQWGAAIDAFDEALQGFSQYKDIRMKAIIAREKGIVYRQTGQYEEAIEVLQHAVELIERFTDHPTIAILARLEIGKVFVLQKRPKLAEDILRGTYEQILELEQTRSDLKKHWLKIAKLAYTDLRHLESAKKLLRWLEIHPWWKPS